MDPEAVLRAYLASGDAGDMDALGRYVAEDVVVHEAGGLTTIGIDYEREVWQANKSVMPDLRHEVQEVVAQGDRLAARVLLVGTLNGIYAGLEAEEAEIEVDIALFVHMRDDKIGEIWELIDTTRYEEEDEDYEDEEEN
jgi:predicted ester cyclase